MALPDLTDIFIADSYKGMLHTSNIPIKDYKLPPVYDGLGNKSALRLGQDGWGVSINGSLSANNLAIKGYETIIDYLYPIGSVFISIENVNPQSRFKGTSWTRIAQGKFIAGVGSFTDKNGDTEDFKAEDPNNNGQSGSFRHTLKESQMPSHTHKGVTAVTGASDALSLSNIASSSLLFNKTRIKHENSGHTSVISTGAGTTFLELDGAVDLESVGGGESHPNTPPAFGMYFWKRIS